ncbi:MAG: hypothetical protein IPK76_22690 [Lewinellaceae bacterium]|nr:hypothetical protein [Lewinellaceae bacterium]
MIKIIHFSTIGVIAMLAVFTACNNVDKPSAQQTPVDTSGVADRKGWKKPWCTRYIRAALKTATATASAT